MISKDLYIAKKEEMENNVKSIKMKISKLLSDEINNENDLTNKIEELKRLINKRLNDDNMCISDSIIDGLIEKVTVLKEKFIVKINCDIKPENKDVLLTKLIITKDDVYKFQRNHKQYKRLRLKEPIIVEIVM